ncbi:hypothetical protein BD324DRAFT_395331 [Kockovaella imperatae]|uniref:NAA35-like N-terminal domain-containing protein n=1 Tax=Kockovaella imperatae TaxID=4999 RepID=A0A1Y1UKT7_9TREE|nr:hypothetical protein BD324DRAFT_395331 [Kockovaella imperatae]ORX37745.1 hypothetical protein BD324DRAFT_395331 [Kockovaella imperatae]
MKASFLDGASLARTVFACVYYHRPELAFHPENATSLAPFVRAYSLAFAKCVELAVQELSRGHVHDFEDAWLDTFGIPVRLDDTVHDIVRELRSAMARCDDIPGADTLGLGTSRC